MAQQIIIGNTAQPKGERFNWVLYVRGATDLIQKVTIKLHPTFKDPVRTSEGPTFEFKSNGWGTFDIDVIIEWKDKTESVMVWELQFDAPDKSSKFDVPPDVVRALEANIDSAAEATSCKQQVESDGGVNSNDPSGAASGSAKATSRAKARAKAKAAAPDPGMKPAHRDEGSREESPLDLEAMRTSICSALQEVGYVEHSHPLFKHGRGYQGPLSDPRCTWSSPKPPRDDHDAPKWLTASEFEDDPNVMLDKCRQLALLMRLSRKTVCYTGAGISAAVIGQAARSGQNTTGWKADTRKAQPTFTHHALGFLGQQGVIHSWVQQNHDGLPQKAGFPQECINEIHGSWYDPCNPVVKYSGTLHDRAYPWMEHDADTADLVLVLGTSLGGLNADQVVTKTARRTLFCDHRAALGSVIMNLQQTEQDGKMTLRMFGKSDDILRMLLNELGFSMTLRPVVWPTESRALVPYDARGRRLPPGSAAKRMWLDLRDRSRVRIADDHNIQGARQPMYMHIGASKPYKHNGETRQPGVGLGTVTTRDEDSASFLLRIEGVQMRLGIWWLESAIRGGVEALPVVNTDPKFEGD